MALPGTGYRTVGTAPGARPQAIGTANNFAGASGAWRYGKHCAFPTSPHPRRRLWKNVQRGVALTFHSICGSWQRIASRDPATLCGAVAPGNQPVSEKRWSRSSDVSGNDLFAGRGLELQSGSSGASARRKHGWMGSTLADAPNTFRRFRCCVHWLNG